MHISVNDIPHKRSLHFVISETAMIPGQNPLMIGRASIERKIKQLELAGLKDVRPQTLKVFSKFFSVSFIINFFKYLFFFK